MEKFQHDDFDDLPPIDDDIVANPKGVGEAGTIGAPSAVVSAMCDALSVAHIDMPVTLSKIWNNRKKLGD